MLRALVTGLIINLIKIKNRPSFAGAIFGLFDFVLLGFGSRVFGSGAS
jgi:hypothetical protein